MALAILVRTWGRGIGRRGVCRFLVGRVLGTLGAATAIPPRLGLAVLATVGRLSVTLPRASSSPQAGGGLAFRAAIPRLRMGWPKGFFTPFQETLSLARPRSPLTGPSRAASWRWAQGSCELPTAKPRTWSSLLRSEAPLFRRSAFVARHHRIVQCLPFPRCLSRGPPGRDSVITGWDPTDRDS
jgi:hypothetical protein